MSDRPETTRSGPFIKIGGFIIWEGDPDYPAADAEMQRRFEAACEPLKTTLHEALSHLGFVLKILAELSPNDRCQALDEAQAFYNAARPDARIEPMEGYVTRLVSVGPLDWPMRAHR